MTGVREGALTFHAVTLLRDGQPIGEPATGPAPWHLAMPADPESDAAVWVEVGLLHHDGTLLGRFGHWDLRPGWTLTVPGFRLETL